MYFKRFVLLCAAVLLGGQIFAQGKITGKVIDKQANAGIEYASVTLLKPSDSSLVTGAVTTSNGSFAMGKVSYGKYILRVTFMGYKTYFHPTPIVVSANNPSINVGKIYIAPSATTLEAAQVTAERTMVEYQLDKRVINVDKNIVTGGGTATDILENVPSVAIDNDGNVTLRGSSNVKVLIDGRPYELMSSDLETLLEQIPASTVENVEVITNPSAKYDPEGMSGIINIKLKDKSQGALGLNGVVNANLGAPLPFMIPDNMPKFIPTTMASVNLNYSTEKYNLFFSADCGIRSRANTSTNYIERRNNWTPWSIDSLIESSVGSNYMGSMKIGGEYYFNKKNSLLVSYQLRGGTRMRQSQVESFDLFSTPIGYLDHHQEDTNSNTRMNHVVNVLYTKKFDEKDRLLTVDMTFSARRGWGDGMQEQTYYGDAIWDNYYLRNTESHRRNNTGNIKVNYTHPFGDGWRFETGYEGQIMDTKQNYDYYMTTYKTLDDGSHQLDTVKDNISSMDYLFGQQIHAIYATVGGKIFEGMTAQAGLRGEYSNIYGHDESHTESAPIDKDFWQLYPTLHLSYEINKDQSFQLSYSRRVRRPHMWDLHPYIDVREGQQMSFGNPGLAPEFTNAFELSYNFGYKKLNIFTSLYYRQTDSMMTRYGFVWDATSAAYYSPWMVYNPDYDGYWASTWQNLNKGRNYGMEFIIDYQITKWWKLNVSVNLYESMIEGTELLGGGDTSAFRASGKLNSYMNLPKDWTIQFSGQYRAPFFDLQTNMMASYWFDLAVKKDVLNKRGTINLRVGDVFCTGGFGHTTDSEQLYRVFRAHRISPTITVGFSYKINNGLKQNKRQGGESFDEGEGGEY